MSGEIIFLRITYSGIIIVLRSIQIPQDQWPYLIRYRRTFNLIVSARRIFFLFSKCWLTFGKYSIIRPSNWLIYISRVKIIITNCKEIAFYYNLTTDIGKFLRKLWMRAKCDPYSNTGWLTLLLSSLSKCSVVIYIPVNIHSNFKHRQTYMWTIKCS